MQGGLDRAILLMFVCCGVSRLARYNVTAEDHSNAEGKVTYFEGTPIPTSIVLVAVLCAAASMGALHENLWLGSVRIASLGLHPLSLMFAASGALMVSRIRIPKL
jgi:CDP-diacylglycerol--serine O-phosphatidyltransferase